jgi:cytochrome P450
VKQKLLKFIPFKSLLRPVVKKIQHTAYKALPQKKEILYAFGGRYQYWENMGVELFKAEPAFRESILKSDLIIVELGYPSILSNFESSNNKAFFSCEKNILLTITAVQIAVFDCLKVKKIMPNFIYGLSLGEVAGLYAAGGISRYEAFKITTSIFFTIANEKKEYKYIFFNLSFKKLKKLSKDLDYINPVYEAFIDTSIALVNKDKIKALEVELSKANIQFNVTNQEIFPYHTQNISHYRDDILKSLESLEFKPLIFDYFSTSLGKIVPKGTILSKEFCFNFQQDPVLEYTTINEIKNTGKNLDIVQIGPDLFGGEKILQILANNSFKPHLFSTLTNKQAHKIFKKTISHIKKDGIKNSKSIDNTSEFDGFIQNFTLDNPYYISNPFPFWKYFRKNGSLHYIPNNNCWLVLGYDEIIETLNHPEYFSSKPASFFDKYLIGTDPPSHKIMRGMLQSIFSQNSLARAEEFIFNKTEDLIHNLPKNKEFNFVDYFSLPLSKSVIGYFLGLNEEQSEMASNIIGKEIHEINDDLKAFYFDLLKNDLALNSFGALNHIKELIKEEKLSLDGAASIGRLFWVAGMLTTSILLSNTFWQLMKNPLLINQLKGSDHLINKFIDECLRLLPPETMLTRLTTKEVVLSNKKIPSNSIVRLDLRAGNHDELKFDYPFNISLSRLSNSHLSFGSGVHVCLGMALAKIEARIAIKSYLEVFEKFSPVLEEPITYYASNNIRGPEKFSINFKKN